MSEKVSYRSTGEERPKLPIAWFESIPYFLIHLIAIISLFYVEYSWNLFFLCMGSYFLRMFGITAGYHRYFAHRSYKLNRFWQFCMAFLAQTAAQNGILWWAGHHRIHHKYSDQSEDVHSPKQDGFWWAHFGWFLSKKYQHTDISLVQDFAKYPELRFLDKYDFLPALIYATVLFALGGIQALMWGFFISSVLTWQATSTINSLSHVFGSQRYKSTDTSRNNFFLAILTMGEGWHNNHHTYMTSANQGFYWWEWDPTYYILKALSWVGIVKELRKAPLEQLESKKIIQPSLVQEELSV
ncbi:MAG: acyl-CoA desaturase [Bdellovibrionota bacterium]